MPRSWSGNGLALNTIRRTMAADDRLRVTLPNAVEDAGLVAKALAEAGTVRNA
jgi:hypothetical protein